MAINPSYNYDSNTDISFTGNTSNQLILEYLGVIKLNLIPIILIFLVSFSLTLIYVFNTQNIYRAATLIKLENKGRDILSSNVMEEPLPTGQYFIPNQIEILKSYEIKDRVAQALLDSFNASPHKDKFYYLANKDESFKLSRLTKDAIRNSLGKFVDFEQKKNLDAISIVAEGPSFYELSLVTNIYANEFIKYSLELSRQDIATLKKFLQSERENKLNDLNNIEIAIEEFKNQNQFLDLNSHASQIVGRILQLDNDLKITDLELKTTEKEIDLYLSELKTFDPDLADYLTLQLSSSYLNELQKSIANLEIQRDLDVASEVDTQMKNQVSKDYETKLGILKTLKEKQMSDVLGKLNSKTPSEKKEVTKKLFEANLHKIDLTYRLEFYKNEMDVNKNKLSRIPDLSIALAKLERNKTTNEKLYTVLEEKYQETEIKERTRIGNAYILDPGTDNPGPVKPNRPFILTVGTIIGLGLGLLFAFGRYFLDRSIKNPEALESKGVNMLGWIPSIGILDKSEGSQNEFIVANKGHSSPSEAFKVLRARMQFAKLKVEPIKTILITSSIPEEGKTFVALNLSGSFAQVDKKVLLLDCDLRKPRIHTLFDSERYPGLTDYLFQKVSLDEIIRPTRLENLFYTTTGTIPPNPSEILSSEQMKEFLSLVKEKFDLVIIDSPPLLSVADAEILFNTADGTILIAKANKTPMDIFLRSYQKFFLMNQDNLLGCILNDFSFKRAYGYYYYDYYYYYYNYASLEENGSLKSRIKDRIKKNS